jgi:hypothetical protein
LSPDSLSSRRELSIAVEFFDFIFRESKNQISRVHGCQGKKNMDLVFMLTSLDKSQDYYYFPTVFFGKLYGDG